MEYEAYQKNFYLEAIRGIGLFCNQKQYTNTILTGQSDEELLQSVQSMVKSGRVEGFILLYAREDDPILAYLQAEGVLYVLIGQSKKDLEDTIYVNNDNIQACRELTSMLIEMGHRRIAYISDEWQHNYAQDRKSGYLLAMTEHQLPIRPEYILESSGLPEENDGKLTALFSLPQRPTAIVASDDVLAMALERVVLSLGLRIPQDLSIAAFNDSLFSRLGLPAADQREHQRPAAGHRGRQPDHQPHRKPRPAGRQDHRPPPDHPPGQLLPPAPRGNLGCI